MSCDAAHTSILQNGVNRISILSIVAAVVAMLSFATPTWAGSASEAETRFIEAKGVRYAYRALGPEIEPPLVFLQRFRGNMDDWDPTFLDAVAVERRVILFNNAGVASSGGETPETIKGMAEHAARVIRALGLTQVDVLGWSMGGFVAQALAVDEPSLVRRVVLVGTGPAAFGRTPRPKGRVLEVAMKPRPSREDFEFLFFADDPVSRKRVAPTLARINDARRGASEPRPAADVLARQKTAMEQWWFDPPTGYFDKLSQINQPVLILNGDRDAWFPVASQTLLYEMISDARLAVFPAAGHAAHFQYPKIAAEIVLEFLNMEPKEGLK